MPSDFYKMEFEDFLLLRKGWSDKMVREELLVRNQTFILAMAWGVKLAALEKAWPDPDNPGKTVKMVNYKGMSMTANQMKKLIESKQERKNKKKNG